MPGSSPHEAVEVFLAPLGRAVSCVSTVAHFSLTPGARGQTNTVHQWVLGHDNPLMLSDAFGLRASMHFEVLERRQARRRERYKVHTRGYMYSVVDSAGGEVVAFHWHPEGSSPWRKPHMHVGSAALADDGVFPKRAHIPTPRISFEYVIRWSVLELGVSPVRDDWQDVLGESQKAFEDHKSW